ncbi:lipoyl(octanoyl) transferase LipB [Rhodospirillaceae bacterium KN72]|uniref:Octanoyltransferase n=1 Tax=Pacificispira spongiicola TaxID=2729598 RepID=A0A7Y0E3K5_9PROT|nr:lipoyl(octanoyl) transferase LipB [Pacificispira spongiicola]NMM46622.1 lipoyl(octanoyl) transferase LipB [Pacificispira spongiicola]
MSQAAESCAVPRRTDITLPEWRISESPVAYETALAEMEARVADIHAGTAGELVWLLEHPPLYTAGTSAKAQDLLTPDRFPVYKAGRGGQYTYHGPGQRIAYTMLDLTRRGRDVRCFVHDLEEWVIRALAQFNVVGERRDGRVGIWVDRGDGREDKIAAIGVRVRHWITFHGISINVEPDLSHFGGIVPCGIGEENLGVTSLVDLGLPVTMADLDVALASAFAEVFGPPGAIPPGTETNL